MIPSPKVTHLAMRLLTGTALVFFASLALASAAKVGPEYAKLHTIRVQPAPLKDALVTQFVAADRKGRTFVLRGDTMQVFRLRDDGNADLSATLKCANDSAFAYLAAMDPEGTRWLVSNSLMGPLFLCDSAEQQRPSGFIGMVSSVTYSRTGPLVAVIPGGSQGPDPENFAGTARVPRILALEDGRWKPVSTVPIPRVTNSSVAPIVQIKAQNDAFLCTGAKDSMWLASLNTYHLQQISSNTDKPTRDIAVGKNDVEWVKLTQREKTNIVTNLKDQGVSHPEAGIAQTYPRNVIRALVCEPHGTIYLLANTPDGLALDRFDPSQDLLERVLLEGVAASEGPMTVAFGTDELWIAGRTAAEGLWRISLNSLATAPWKRVQEMTIDGKAAP